MPYKNSAGNTGISNQYGQWRYFTASLGRLEDYRAPRLNVQAQPVVAKEQADWGKAVLGVTQGLLGLFEMRRNASYKAADDWLAKHSLEEYHDLMKKGNVPFQDDPLAMQRLKFRHGEILSDIAQRDFQSRIDKGEFVGMEPEEIDAENFKYMNQVLTEDTDVYPYKADGDYFFNQGFWANSNKFRSEVFSKSKAVDDDYTKQQALIETQASLVKMIEGGANAKQINDAFALSRDAYGHHFTPNEYQKVAATVADQLSNTPWGDQVLDQLKDMKVPSLGNLTYKDIMGGEKGIQDMKVSAVNFRYSNDMELRRSDRNTIESLVDRGDVEELQRRAMEIRGQDGGDSTRFKLWWDAVAKAQTQREKLFKQRAKQYKEGYEDYANLLGADTYLSWLKNDDSRFMSDRQKDYWSDVIRTLGNITDPDVNVKLTKENIDKVFEQRWRDGSLTPNDVANIAGKGYDAYNPAREFINRSSRSMISTIQGQINNAISNPSTRIEEPDNFRAVMEIYGADPSTFGNLSSEDTLMMQTLYHGMSSGLFNYEQAVRSMSWYASQDKDSRDIKMIKNRVIKRDITDKLSLTALGYGGSIDNTPMCRALVQTMAGNFKLMGLDTEEAINKAVEQINTMFYQVGNNMVPKRFFSNNKLTTRGTEIAVAKWADGLEKRLADRYMDFSNVNIWFNPFSNSVEVIDVGSGEVYETLTNKAFNALLDKEQENIFIKVKAEDFKRASGGTGVVPETFAGGD